MTNEIEDVVRDAVGGDAAALEEVVARIRDDLYGLALRMLGHPADAEDATQEILIKVVTHLADFRGESRFRTWTWTIAQRHLMRFRKSRMERAATSFDVLAHAIDAGRGVAPSSTISEPELRMLAEEVKLGCTQAMLVALTREDRLALLVCDIFGLPGREAAAVLELEPAALRKRVSRARRKLGDFMRAKCGLMDAGNDCRCERQVPLNIQYDLIDPERLVYLAHAAQRPNRRVTPEQLAEVAAAERIAEIFRSSPEYAAPARLMEGVREVLTERGFGFLR